MFETWKAGCGERVISPEIGTSLAGYGYNTDRRAETVRDDLKARAVYLENGGGRLLLVSCDLLNIATPFADEIRTRLAERCGLAAEAVMIGCIHTHGGPSFRDDAYRARAIPRIVEAGAAAVADAAKVTALSRRFEAIEPIGYNRRTGDFSGIDPMLRTIFIERCDGRVIVLWSYACHPVVFGPLKRVSADYPGEVNRQLAAAGLTGVFLQGCCGDIDPVINRNRWGAGDDDDLETLGGLLARRILKCRRLAEALTVDRLAVRSEKIDFPLQVPDSPAAIDQEAAARIGSSAIPGADDFLRDWAVRAKADWAKWRRDPFLHDVPLTLAQIGEVAILAIPGEPFAAYALKLAAVHPALLPWGYADGMAGYLPTAAAYEDAQDYACYQICKAYRHLFPFAPEIEARIVEAASRLLAAAAK
jgi:hypothetical protein